MDNNQKKNQTATRVDSDGNMQVRSSGANHAPARRPAVRRTVAAGEKTSKKSPAARSGRAPGVEYSFTNTGLFGNSDEKVQPTAAQESRRTRTDKTPAVRDTNTRVVASPTRALKGVRGGAHSISGARSASARRSSAGGTQRRNTVDNSATRVTPAVKTRTPAKRSGGSGGTLGSISSALLYIAIVMIVSIILSVIIINNANDVFAFVKDDKSYIIEIGTGCDLDDLAEQLHDLGVIKYKNTFKLYTKFRHNDSDAYDPGTYTVSSSMNYDQLIKAITPTIERESVVVTIPEGYTCEEIIDLLVSKGVGSRERYEDVIQNYDFDYWFIDQIPANADRYYRLEGYLFPDTYYFFTDSTEETVIDKFLQNFNNKFDAEYKAFADRSYMSVDQIITLASIIQAEGKGRTVTVTEEVDGSGAGVLYVDYGMISSVFHNRMNINMRLQSDATTLFALKMEKTGEDTVTGSNKNFENPYNTYNINGLPPGAICNPGLSAISFAMWPDNSKYYYFLSDSSGATYFSETLDEHQALEQKYLK